MRLFFIILLFAAISLWSQSKTSDLPSELYFGIISTESNSALKKGFEPFLKEIEKKIEIPIRAFFATDYAGVIEAMRFGKIQIAWMGNKAALEAIDRADAEIFAQTSAVDGSRGYYSLIIAHKDSPYSSLEDIIEASSKLTFGNGDPNSTSGYLIPQCYIWSKKNIDPKKIFKTVRNANHESNCIAVATKQVDFATNNTEFLEKFKISQPEKYATLKVLWKSPEIPNDPVLYKKDLHPEVKNRIKAALLSFGRIGPDANNEREILKNVSTGWGLFYDSNNDQLLSIRELELLSQKDKTNAANLNEKEKKLKLDEIEDKLDKIKKFQTLDNYLNAKKF